MEGRQLNHRCGVLECDVYMILILSGECIDRILRGLKSLNLIILSESLATEPLSLLELARR
jgi:hypothetical protein